MILAVGFRLGTGASRAHSGCGSTSLSRLRRTSTPRPSQRASFSERGFLRASRCLDGVRAAPAPWLAFRPSRPAALAPLVRPPPDGRCARHATACSGTARCGQVGQTSHHTPLGAHTEAPAQPVGLDGSAEACPQRAARRPWCGRLAQRGAMRRASQSSDCGGSTRPLAGRHDQWNRKKARRKLRTRKGCPRKNIARRASRGVEVPRRGRRARDSTRSLEPTATGGRSKTAR